jgi:hypothetical protein
MEAIRANVIDLRVITAGIQDALGTSLEQDATMQILFVPGDANDLSGGGPDFATFIGSVPIVITSSSIPNRLNVVSSLGTFKQAGPNLVLLPGSITAIPEPSAFLAVGAVVAIVILSRGWRRACKTRIAKCFVPMKNVGGGGLLKTERRHGVIR